MLIIGDSDLLTIYNAYCSWKRVRATSGASEYTFCRQNFLSVQTLVNIEELKTQLIVSMADTGLLQLDESEQNALKR
jgi:ATP-dependent RNA helicase DHX29